MKFQYRTNESFTLDAFNDVEYYSLGSLDDYQFRRKKISSNNQAKILADSFLKIRIKNLRRKYSYIRLWYSGGKDSTLALNTAIKNNVLIDEIVVIRRTCKLGPNLYSEFAQIHEIDHAIGYLNSLRDQIPNTKISVIEIDDEQHETILEDPNWFRYTSEWYFAMGYSMNMFYRYLNPKFHFLENVSDRCDLCGAAVPDVWYDYEIKKWKFQFDDAVFVTAHGGEAHNTTFEDFLITEDFPQLLDFFVNTIVDDIEREYKKNGSVDYVYAHGERQRKTRDRSALYQTLENYKNFQFKKDLDSNFKLPFDHFVWKIDGQPKTVYELANRYFQEPKPKCFDLYVNQTPWSLIAPRIENKIKTKVWILE